jgi:hypothetical protein
MIPLDGKAAELPPSAKIDDATLMAAIESWIGRIYSPTDVDRRGESAGGTT